jgi:hypothetical protein
MKNIITKLMNNKLVKLLFSITIIVASIPSIIQDFEQPVNGWTHYGLLAVGLSYFLESLLWVLDIWKK